MIRMRTQLGREDAAIVRELCSRFPKLCRGSQHNRNVADPWLIATAYTENLTVVTEEGRGEQQIPKVCESRGLPWSRSVCGAAAASQSGVWGPLGVGA